MNLYVFKFDGKFFLQKDYKVSWEGNVFQYDKNTNSFEGIRWIEIGLIANSCVSNSMDVIRFEDSSCYEDLKLREAIEKQKQSNTDKVFYAEVSRGYDRLLSEAMNNAICENETYLRIVFCKTERQKLDTLTDLYKELHDFIEEEKKYDFDYLIKTLAINTLLRILEKGDEFIHKLRSVHNFLQKNLNSICSFKDGCMAFSAGMELCKLATPTLDNISFYRVRFTEAIDKYLNNGRKKN